MNLKEFGIEKDKNDILKSFKSRFVNNPNEIYLDGNSLGKLPKTSYSEISELVKNQWGSKLISSWNDHWLKLSEDINLNALEKCVVLFQMGTYVGLDIYKSLEDIYPQKCDVLESIKFLEDNNSFIDY